MTSLIICHLVYICVTNKANKMYNFREWRGIICHLVYICVTNKANKMHNFREWRGTLEFE